MGANPWVRAAYAVKELAAILGFVSENEEEILFFLRKITFQKIFEAQEQLAVVSTSLLESIVFKQQLRVNELTHFPLRNTA